MSEHSQAFITYLQRLRETDRGAIATLRHSLGFPLGDDPKVFPLVERFAGKNTTANDPYRLALYAVAGFYARHPAHGTAAFAEAFGALCRERGNPSIEQRFIALLYAYEDTIVPRLRQAIDFLAANDVALNYATLLTDLADWLAATDSQTRRGKVRQAWGRHFYLAASSDQTFETEPEAFVNHLIALASAESSAASLARLRRSLTQPPGEDPSVFAMVEPFIDRAWKNGDPRRRARYLVAGLFATHPHHTSDQRFASALNRRARQEKADSDGIERRFIALLGASSDTLADHLRQLVIQLRQTAIGYDAVQLLKDLEVWIRRSPNIAALDQRRQSWARDFYAVPRKDKPIKQSKQPEGA